MPKDSKPADPDSAPIDPGRSLKKGEHNDMQGQDYQHELGDPAKAQKLEEKLKDKPSQ